MEGPHCNAEPAVCPADGLPIVLKSVATVRLTAAWYAMVLFACVASWNCGDEPVRSPSAPAPAAATPQPPPAPNPIWRLRLLGENGERELAFGEADLGEYRHLAFRLCNDGPGFPITDIRGPVGFDVILDWEYRYEIGIPAQGCASGAAYFVPLAAGVHQGDLRVESDRPVEIEGRLSGTGIRPSVARTVFGEGSFLVNLVIAPGRYFADPNGTCWWGRRADFLFPSGNYADFLADRASWFDPGQWIVDILPSDFQFISDIGCGYWGQEPSVVLDREAIDPGMWLVNRQIRPGRYRTTAAAGCDWERLRHFQGTPDGVIASGWSVDAAMLTVDIRSTDAGFLSTRECGRWRRIS